MISENFRTTYTYNNLHCESFPKNYNSLVTSFKKNRITFSANLAYLPSSVIQSLAQRRRCAMRYLRIPRCGGRTTEQARDSRAQWRRFTRELGSGCSVVCLISCRYSSPSRLSFLIASSITFWIRLMCSSSARLTVSPDRTDFSHLSLILFILFYSLYIIIELLV